MKKVGIKVIEIIDIREATEEEKKNSQVAATTWENNIRK